MNKTIPGGLLVAVDGIDGAGKTTLAHGLASALGEHNIPTVISKEPTAGPWGRKVRESAITGRATPAEELDYLLRDRTEHVRELIGPALADGQAVILDRYYFSTVAYQGAVLDPDEVLRQNEAIAPRPDLTLILDLDVESSLGRIAARGDKPNHFERMGTLTVCRDVFQGIGRTYPNAHLLDAREPASAVLRRALELLVLAIGEKFLKRHGLTQEAVEAAMPIFATR